MRISSWLVIVVALALGGWTVVQQSSIADNQKRLERRELCTQAQARVNQTRTELLLAIIDGSPEARADFAATAIPQC